MNEPTDMSITFHGAALRVTGSCSLIQCGQTRILVDCGMIQGDEHASELNRADFPFSPSELDAVVLTHGHLDHVGRVPRLVDAGYGGPILTHPASAELADIVWRDTSRLSAWDGEPIFTEATVDRTGRQVVPLRYGQPHQVGPIGVRLFDAGHILGSGHALIEAGGKRLVMSGDVGQANTPIIRDPTTDWDGPVDAVVIESTYGNRLHKPRAETVEEFREIIREAVDHRGLVLIPAFAIGRTQELLFQFNAMVEAGELPRVPVLLDSPMAGRVTEVYRKHRECYDQQTWQMLQRGNPPMRFPGLRELESAEQSKQVKSMAPPAIVIAGSGMCTGGRIIHHLKDFLDKPTTTVVFVGWQGYGTLGRRLVDGEKRVKMYGEQVEVRARIETLNGFSAHADRDGLIDWARAIPGKPRFWLANHGEEDAARGLVQALDQAGMAGCQAVEPDQTVEI